MSYANRNTAQAKTATLITVTAVHAALGYLLITKLGISYIPEYITNLEAHKFWTPPPKPDEPQVREDVRPERESVVDTVRSLIMPRDESAYEVNVPELGSDERDNLLDLMDIPEARPAPLFTPVAPKPRTSPGGWVSPDDYPAHEIRRGNEGASVFRLAIGTDGRITGCRIVRSSGHPALDGTTCSKVSQRASFDPARDETGRQVAGAYTGSVTWVIPD